MRLAPSTVQTITLSKGDEEQTVRKDESGVWRLVLPAAGHVEADAVQGVLGAVANLKAMRLEGQARDGLASYGLDPPSMKLTMGVSSAQGIRKTLMIGFLAGTDGVYAMVQGQDMIFVLPRDLVGLLGRNLVAADEVSTVR